MSKPIDLEGIRALYEDGCENGWRLRDMGILTHIPALFDEVARLQGFGQARIKQLFEAFREVNRLQAENERLRGVLERAMEDFTTAIHEYEEGGPYWRCHICSKDGECDERDCIFTWRGEVE